jgi:hypothetical protein
MTEHLPECLINRAYAVRVCICRQLSACEARVIAAAEADEMRCAEKVAAAYRLGQRDALDAAREAIEAIPAPYKIRGDFETYGNYSEGKTDMKDAALSAIDALREKQ